VSIWRPVVPDGEEPAQLGGPVVKRVGLRFVAFFSASHAARCTARHGVGSYAEPPTMECAMATGKKFARQSRSPYAVNCRS
jgi:hypothetical protein